MPTSNSMSMRVLVFAMLGLAVITLACHPRFKHVDGVHSDADLENWCVQMHTQAMTDDAARQSVELFMEDGTL